MLSLATLLALASAPEAAAAGFSVKGWLLGATGGAITEFLKAVALIRAQATAKAQAKAIEGVNWRQFTWCGIGFAVVGGVMGWVMAMECEKLGPFHLLLVGVGSAAFVSRAASILVPLTAGHGDTGHGPPI